jgi:hypothetical protein
VPDTVPDTMRAAVLDRFGGPEVLTASAPGFRWCWAPMDPAPLRRWALAFDDSLRDSGKIVLRVRNR